MYSVLLFINDTGLADTGVSNAMRIDRYESQTFAVLYNELCCKNYAKKWASHSLNIRGHKNKTNNKK